jgi:cytochrome b subunit of formate dehydrogenase
MDMSTQFVSKQTQHNWWIDVTLFGSALIAVLSGIYFLFLPSGGFQGGRNPLYNVQILFSRQTWDDLHTWSGIAMIAAAVLHLALHWPWVVGMARRTWNELIGRCDCMNPRGRWNLILDTIVAISFVLTAISGVYFLFAPSGRRVVDPMILFSRATWDLIHTWAGVVLVSVALIHFIIHWRWVANVSRKMFKSLFPSGSVSQSVPASN